MATDQHASAVALLSLAVFFRLVAGGQGALIQGMRRISDLAKMGILGALYGTVISIPMVYYLREDGVVPALVAAAAMSIVTSWWYSRKVRIQPPSMTVSQVRHEAAGLLKLGFAFMASGFLDDGGRLCGPDHRRPPGGSRSGRLLSIRMDAGRTVCGVYSAGHGSGLLSHA